MKKRWGGVETMKNERKKKKNQRATRRGALRSQFMAPSCTAGSGGAEPSETCEEGERKE